MELRNILLQSPDFAFENNIFWQKNLTRARAFENIYLSLREKENRIYPDEIVSVLPELDPQHPLAREWRDRKLSSEMLTGYLAARAGNTRMLDVGCGNGWLSNRLATIPGSEVLAIDVNETELAQAARVFSQRVNLSFAYAEIAAVPVDDNRFDYIILSAAIQYFPKIETLLNKLLHLLAAGGEIHILDSPIYNDRDAALAKTRTEAYCTSAGFPAMAQHYHHHTWNALSSFAPATMYNPNSIMSKIRRNLSLAPPFPWLRITKVQLK